MTNLNREPIGPFQAPARGWDGQEPELPGRDSLMEDDPGIYQGLLIERDEAMERYAAVRSENRQLRTQVERLRYALREISLVDLSVDGAADLCMCHTFQAVAKQALDNPGRS